MQGSRNSGNFERRGGNENSRYNHDCRQRKWRNSEVLHRQSNSRNNYRGNYESGRQRNSWLESRTDRRFDRGYQLGNRVQKKILVEGTVEIGVRVQILVEIVSLDLLGPYPVSRVRRNRYILVITDHFSNWAEIIPLKKASARIIGDSLFDLYISHYGAPLKLISDNDPQYISDIFEHLSNRLGIRQVNTVVYRPQANRTERVNRDLVQMTANYVNDQHDTWDQFLRELSYSIRISG
ncbi:retrovirus-related Pol polyprotein from transposon 17.6 [Trichonephila clavipes]|nr:retrovirus-related Pol polyprotein from transposon 17.6 [Trichonephila clavipes]